MPKKSQSLRSATAFYCSFDAHTMHLLDRIVEEAWQELARRQSPMASNERLIRELLAHRVMARASQGELDPHKLKEHALWELLD